MKYITVILATGLFAGLVLAESQDTVKLCSTMLLQKQQQIATANKITASQATTYCQCIVPQLESLQKNTKTPSSEELNTVFANCMNKAGMKQPSQ